MYLLCNELSNNMYYKLPGKYDGGADDDGGPLRDRKSSI